jgi:pilus assembly protein CpaB
MRMKSLILIFIALGCGLVASIGISQVMERGGSTGPALETEQILVALIDIDAGSKLDVNNIRLEEWPKNKVPEAAIRRVDDAKGKFAVPRFFKGEPIVATRISETANGVAELIPEGYRAIPVKMEEETVMKAISPGDRVDVSVFLKKDNNEIFKTGVFPIIRNVQIFAVNSNTERTIDAKGGEAAFRTVSLLVKEKQVGELELAKRVGSIQLSLRRRNESDDAIGEETTPMSELLAGKSQMGGDPVLTSPTDNLNNLLANGPGGAAPVASEWQMNIQGPNGVEQWSWASRQGLPAKSTVLNLDVGGSPATPASSNNSAAPPGEQPSETTTEEATDVTTTPAE